jgi:RNA polymerase sigma-70 factor (ECF subfamily)
METDQALLNAARMMDRNALVKIFDLYSPVLYKYALRLCGDSMLADQVVGDVFAKLLDQLSAGNGPTAHLRSYLYETTYHRIIDEARYARRRVSLAVTDWFPQSSDPAFLRLEDQILFEQIVHAIHTELTHDQRHVIILRFMEEFSLRETAAILGKQVGHVKVIQGRALAKIRWSLQRHKGMRTVPSPRIRTIPETLGI